MIWFSSDLHLSHKNICYYANRPFSFVDEMNEVLIQNWNNVVGLNDIVYHLGDFSFGNASSQIKLLNGTKFFVRGNHEKPLINAIGEKNVPYMRIIKVENYPDIILCHYAMRVWHKSHFGSYCLFGHSHGKLEPYKKSVDVGVDSNWITGKKEYRPFNIEEIHNFLKTQDGEKLNDKSM